MVDCKEFRGRRRWSYCSSELARDGNGAHRSAVFRPSNGTWIVQRSTAGLAEIQFGNATDIPVAGDYDGDGRTDIAVYRNGFWYFSICPTCPLQSVSFGLPTDKPVPDDYDADGKTDVAVWRPSNGFWYTILSATNAFSAVQFGQPGDIPIPAR